MMWTYLVFSACTAEVDPLDRCLQHQAVSDPAERSKHVAEHCMTLYKKTRCRDSWTTISEIQLQTEAITTACREDYCSLLLPQPQICLRPELSKQSKEWRNFHLQILRYDQNAEPGSPADKKLQQIVDSLFNPVQSIEVPDLQLPVK